MIHALRSETFAFVWLEAPGTWSRLILLGVVLDPLTEPEAVGLWTDGREGAARVSQTLPQMLKTLPQAVNCKNVDDANEVALLWPVDHVERVLQVWQQAPVLGLQVRQLSLLWVRVREAGCGISSVEQLETTSWFWFRQRSVVLQNCSGNAGVDGTGSWIHRPETITGNATESVVLVQFNRTQTQKTREEQKPGF